MTDMKEHEVTKTSNGKKNSKRTGQRN